MVAAQIYQGINIFLEIISYAVAVYCLLTWFLPPYHKVMRFLSRFVDPLLRPIRNVMYRLFPHMRIDFSPIVFFLLLRLLRSLILKLFMLLFW